MRVVKVTMRDGTVYDGLVWRGASSGTVEGGLDLLFRFADGHGGINLAQEDIERMERVDA